MAGMMETLRLILATNHEATLVTIGGKLAEIAVKTHSKQYVAWLAASKMFLNNLADWKFDFQFGKYFLGLTCFPPLSALVRIIHISKRKRIRFIPVPHGAGV